jgi:predicted dehydrogenase
MPAAVKIAVVGLGVMGERHARAVAAHPDAVLTAVIDIDAVKCNTLAKELSCTAYEDVSALPGAVNAAIIATPTATHASLAAFLLANGVSCLVEKPFVATVDEGAQLVQTAQTTGAILQIGHIERFNPAIRALLAHVTEEVSADIRAITARRISGASARVTDIDVVMDLMVHDIDVALALKRKPVAKVDATGNAHEAEARVTFSDGSIAVLTASRARPERIRDLKVETGGGTFAVDYIARALSEIGNGATNRLPVTADDALTAQLSAFIAAVHGDGVIVPADDATAVMDVAWRVQKALGLPS